MKRNRLSFLSAATLLIGSQATAPEAVAYGFCSQPMAPTVFLSKPNKPFCANTRGCDQWEVDSYRNDVDQYFRQLREYASDVDDFHLQASDYIECMAELD